MRINIVGAPGTGKKELAYAVSEKVPHMAIFGVPDWDLDDPALGAQADYRTELTLALDRMDASLNDDDMIYTHSLIDSVAYTATNFSNGADTLSEETLGASFLTAHTIAAILRDSLRYDYVFFVPGGDDEYAQQIDAALEAVLIEFKIPYIELGEDQAENVEMISSLVYGRNVGERTDLQEPDGND